MQLTLMEFIILMFHELMCYVLTAVGVVAILQMNIYLGAVVALLLIFGEWTSYTIWKNGEDLDG